MYCSKCGKEMPDTAKFCTACGAPAAKDQAERSASDPAQEGNRTRRILWIGIASVLALAVMIAGGMVYYANRNTGGTGQDIPAINKTRQPESEDVPVSETVISTGFVARDDGLYYYDADGALAKGWFEENGSRYFAADEGRIYRNGSFEIDGVQYMFDGEGRCIGDERTFAEEDAKLLQTLNEQSNLSQLMTELVYWYVGSGNLGNPTAASETVQTNLNLFLSGEQEALECILMWDDFTAAGSMGYDFDNMPSYYQELMLQNGYAYFLTEEQAEYLVYSICGKQIDIDLSHNDGWHEPYLGVVGADGDHTRNELRNFSVERIDADAWQVRADVYYGGEEWSSYIWKYMESVAEICFTVIKNPDSYFDGYSIARAEVELTGKNTAWKDAYITYIEAFEQEINDQIDDLVSEYGMDAQEEADMRARIRYDLIYLNDDDIPELYMEYPIDPFYQEARIITCHNGQLIDSRDEYEWSFCEYIERSGLCYGECDRMEHYGCGVYKLENGRWQMMGSGRADWNGPDVYFEWNGMAMPSEEEFERNINAVYDKSHSSECGQSISVLELIKLICPDAEIIYYDEEYYAAENDSSSETAPNGIISNGIRYFTNNDEFEAALTQEQYDLWIEFVGPELYGRYGGQLYFEEFDGVVLRASSAAANVTVTYDSGWTGIGVLNK